MSPQQQKEVSLLILGAGWLFQFLHPLLLDHGISFVATTTTGRDGTIKWTFPDEATHALNDGTQDEDSTVALNASSSDVVRSGFDVLPPARAVLITFPVKGADAMKRLVRGYEGVHPEKHGGDGGGGDGGRRKWILLGSTGIYPAPSKDSIASTTTAVTTTTTPRNMQGVSESQGPSSILPPTAATAAASTHQPRFPYLDESSPATPSPRYHAEQALLFLKPSSSTVLNLAGLHGEPLRDAKIWERAVPKTRVGVGGKGSVHFIHGGDVSRLVLGIVEGNGDGSRVEKGESEREKGNGVWGRRWIVTDCVIYDWWRLIWDAAPDLEDKLPEDVREGQWTYRKWILELMKEEGVRALPRLVEMLGRALDGRAVWGEVGLVPGEKGFAWPALTGEGGRLKTGRVGGVRDGSL